MSALDGLFGVRQILIDGVATTFRQTLNLLGGWTFAPGSYTDVEGKTIETLELTPPSVGGSGSGFPLAADASAAGHKITSLGAPTAGSTNAATALYVETVAASALAAALAADAVAGGAPGAINLAGITAAAGSDPDFSRQDHGHSISGTLLAANGGTGCSAAALGKQLIGQGGTAWVAIGPASTSLTANTALSKAVADGFRFFTNDAALSTGRTITFGASGAADGQVVNFICTAGGANHYTLDYGNGSMLIDTSRWIDLRYVSGTGWTLAGWQPVS